MRAALVAAMIAAAAAALVAHMRVFDFVTDDAFISFVYSRNLAEHGQLLFNLGEKPVEGYTNFLWTVFLAGWMKLGWRPESSSVFFGVACAIGTMIVCAWWVRGLRSEWERPSPWDALPALILATIPGYACWASGGLETQLFTLLVTLGSALYLVPRDDGGLRIASAAAFGLAALTRPEGNLFFALAGLHLLLGKLARRELLPRRNELAWVALFLALVVPHLLWRHHYYGWWVPNTFYIKASGGTGTWERGLYYLRRFAETFLVWALVAPALLALLARPEAGTRRLLGWAALAGGVFCAYVASVGGDFMGLFRFMMPVVPLVAVAATLGLRTLAARSPVSWAPPLVVAALLAGYAWRARAVDRAALVSGADNGIDSPGFLRCYTANRAAIGKWFGKFARPDDYAVVGGAGAQVYYSGIKSLDAFGLSDEHIAHDVAPVSNRPGYQKYAPLDYELARRPTIITSRYYRIGPVPIGGDEPAAWRQRGYHYVSVRIPGLAPDDYSCDRPHEDGWYTFLKRKDRAIGPLPVDDSP